MASPQGWLHYCHHRHLTGINDGHPSGVDSVLLSFTPDKTGANGWPATRAGWHYCHHRHLTGINDGHPSGVDSVLLLFTPDKTGAIGWPATRAGCIIAIIVT